MFTWLACGHWTADPSRCTYGCLPSCGHDNSYWIFTAGRRGQAKTVTVCTACTGDDHARHHSTTTERN